MTSSYAIAKHQLQAQHLRQKHMHDSHGLAECFQVGDWVWLYIPVVSTGHTKKFGSFWRGPYTIVDKPSEVMYKIQLIGGMIHRNRLKPCFTPPQLQADTVSARHTRTLPDQSVLPTYKDVVAGYMSQVGGYTRTSHHLTNSDPQTSSQIWSIPLSLNLNILWGHKN